MSEPGTIATGFCVDAEKNPVAIAQLSIDATLAYGDVVLIVSADL